MAAMQKFSAIRVLMLGEEHFSGFHLWSNIGLGSDLIYRLAVWEPARALIQDNVIDVVLLDYSWLASSTLPSYVDFFHYAAGLPIIVLFKKDEDVAREQLIAIGAQSVWCVDELESLDLSSLLKSALVRHDRIKMLEDEHKKVAGLLSEIRSGSVQEIKSDMTPSGVLKVLDAKLVEENARLLLKVQAQNRQLKHIAQHDNLTGLGSRLEFEKMLNMTLSRAQRQNLQFAVMLLDLDKFKQVNDTYGHQCGDILLQSVAVRLRCCIRQEDFLARLGGDEFAVIATDLKKPQDAATIAQKIIEALTATPMVLDGVEVNVTVSLGIACYPYAGETPDDLMRHADLAMYRVKEAGRNHFQYFTQDINREHLKRVRIERALETAISNNEFTLCYQPIITLPENKAVGVEALLRWHHPKFGNVSPDEFIPIAEDNSMIAPIGAWVINEALTQLKAWRVDKAFPSTFKMAINLSPKQLLEGGLHDYISKPMRATGLDPESIEFEVTETAVMVQGSDVEKMLHALSAEGFSFSLDDFGTGYSSLAHLKHLPVSTVKIDRSFVADLPENKSSAMIVKSMIAMAKNLGLHVLAEGVETQAQADFLMAEGCFQMQGFYFSKPLSCDALLEFLKK
jgi:diguanylate cyclase